MNHCGVCHREHPWKHLYLVLHEATEQVFMLCGGCLARAFEPPNP